MSSENNQTAQKMPLLGMIGIVCGLVASFIIIPALIEVCRSLSLDDKLLPHISVIVLGLLLLTHFSLFRVARKPQNYKWKWIPLVGVVVSYVLVIYSVVGMIITPSRCEERLTSALAGATSVKVYTISMDELVKSQDDAEYEENDPEKIQEIIAHIDIAPFGYGTSCACEGQQMIEFYQAEKLIAKVSFHHGQNLRWHDNRANGDLQLTAKSAAFFKDWLTQSGNFHFE